jgi:hypothetical protein
VAAYDSSRRRSGLRVTPVQAIDQSMRFVQFATQGARGRVPAGGAPRSGTPVAFIGGFELVRDLGDVSI